jgi:hypothetical protein
MLGVEAARIVATMADYVPVFQIEAKPQKSRNSMHPQVAIFPPLDFSIARFAETQSPFPASLFGDYPVG